MHGYTQKFYRDHIVKRFMSKRAYAQFIRDYNMHKNATARNLPNPHESIVVKHAPMSVTSKLLLTIIILQLVTIAVYLYAY